MIESTDGLLRLTERGLYCEAGDFFVDPWRPVDRAVVTHGHADHARAGSGAYLASRPSLPILRTRLGAETPVETAEWGVPVRMGDVTVSLHPAGHILGSAQVRIEAGPGAARRTGTDLRAGEVWVVTGDYKRAADPTCRSFEPVPCHTLITESTFGLPVYRWPDPDHEIRALRAWWARNRERDRTSVLFAYSLGKAQRILASLGPGPAPILVHGAIRRLNPAYEAAGVELPPTRYADAESARETRGEALVVAPPSAGRSPWIRKFGDVSTAFASGWMRIRGTRRRRAADRGFVLSDHVDWPALLETVRESGAERVGVTHGYTAPTVRYLREQGLEAFVVPTRFEGEEGPAPDDEEESEDGGES